MQVHERMAPRLLRVVPRDFRSCDDRFPCLLRELPLAYLQKEIPHTFLFSSFNDSKSMQKGH